MRQPRFETGKDPVSTFAQTMYPLMYNEWRSRGYSHEDASKIATMESTQAAWESNNGTSRIAKTMHNYGGMRNKKGYITYKDDSDFVKHHADLVARMGLDKAKDLTDYARIAKRRGYYEDSLQHYSNSLNNMHSYANAVRNVALSYMGNQVLLPTVIVQPDAVLTVKPVVIPDPYGDVRLQSTINGRLAGKQAMLNIQQFTPWNPSFRLTLPSLQSLIESLLYQPKWTAQ